jgi:hypothetical protein
MTCCGFCNTQAVLSNILGFHMYSINSESFVNFIRILCIANLIIFTTFLIFTILLFCFRFIGFTFLVIIFRNLSLCLFFEDNI